MKKGFYWIISAQFFSSMADNALLIVAIKLLVEISAPAWATPLLKFVFAISYVVFAAFVAAFADSHPKGRVMLATNLIKISGLFLMIFWVHPLLAYAVVGFGAAAYSPAKYGILTELLPAEKLVAANGWIEGTTVISIILGVGMGGFFVSPYMEGVLTSMYLPFSETPAQTALWPILIFYIAAAVCNIAIPSTGVHYPKSSWHPWDILCSFGKNVDVLWRDKLGQITLAVTTLFWGAGATLQFLVLKWTGHVLGLNLSEASGLQVVFALGITLGAICAGAFVPLKKSLSILWVGIVMGVAVMGLALYSKDMFPEIDIFGIKLYLLAACSFLVVLGTLAGFFVVPMNALLQHRGHVRLTAGQSIAVQNFNENIGILVMLAMYAILIKSGFSTRATMMIFGAFVASSIALVWFWCKYNMRRYDCAKLIGEEKE